MNKMTISLIGNPNSGKTSLFNALTGTRQRTGNWPGVTIERKEGDFQYAGQLFHLIDLPGTYSLDIDDTSTDERIARDFILSHEGDIIVNIVDATHLERSLYLTLQLLEMDTPVILAVNMVDLAEKQGLAIDISTLHNLLGIPVVAVNARRGDGLEVLKSTLLNLRQPPKTFSSPMAYPSLLQAPIEALESHLQRQELPVPIRWLALHLLSGHPPPVSLPPATIALADQLRGRIDQNSGEDPELLIADAFFTRAREIAQAVTHKKTASPHTVSDHIDLWVTHRWLGVPIFLLAMYLMFTFTINFGGAFIDFFDQAAAALLVDGLGKVLTQWGAPGWLRVFLADGLGGGIQVVATFIPIIGFLYLFLTFLEDSGYMARAAFVMDRLMYRLGLPGKAFVPLIVGFGCNVPAIMAARTLERERERILTVMMAPFMSCGARLAVYALFAAAFFPHQGQNIVFALYLIGIAAAMFTAFLLKSTLLPGEPEALLMELPTYQWPSWKNLILHTWLRLRGFVTDAGKYIVMMVMVVNVLNAWSVNGEFGDVAPEDSMLSAAARTITPAFEPLGIRQDNWPATVGIMAGVLAKEVVVGTLDALYSRMDSLQDGPSSDQAPFALMPALKDAAATIPENLREAMNSLTDPLGFRVLENASDPTQAAQAQEIDTSTFGAMVRRFDGTHGAFAYLLFVLLYFPCVAATATIRRETGLRWMAFAIAWTTGLAYSTATLYYQAVTYPAHPQQSAAWLGGILLTLALFYSLLKFSANRMAPLGPPATPNGTPGLLHRSCCK